MRLSAPTAIALGLVAAAAASSAAAQQAAPAPSPARTANPPSDNAVSAVVVTGERPAVVTSIDRKTYAVSRDVTAANGSVTDAMRNLPSVEVDVDGNVSLRGESSVQILLDGKPSGMFSGENRAQALQQLPASSVESIEIITNPSAEFSPDGTGGVINIVTKKIRKVGRSGSVQAGVGSFGRWNLNALGAYNDGPLAITGSLGGRLQGQRQSSLGETTLIDPILNLRTDTADTNYGETDFTSLNATANLDYDITKTDRLSLNGSAFLGDQTTANLATQVRTDANGVVTRDYDIALDGSRKGGSGNLAAGWRHAFVKPGEVFNLQARWNGGANDSRNRLVYVDRTPAGGRTDDRLTENSFHQLGLTASYVLPLPQSASLKAGYEFRRDEVEQDVSGNRIDANGLSTPLQNFSNDFIYVERNHQAYATYQRPFGKLTVLAGARVELAQIEYDQRTTAISGRNEYTDIHPSLHLQYALTDHQNLTASYSHRVQRPGNSQLNPFLIISTEFSATQGNPNLRPQETHSWEAGWQWQESGSSAAATIYYRQNYNTIGPVNRFLTPLILLNTYENQGTSTSGGLELDAGSRIGQHITYRGNANISYNEIQRSSLGGGGTRSSYSYTLRGNLDYKPTTGDLIQLTGNYAGKQIFAQGYRPPSGTLNIGYQHKFSPKLISVVTISDVLASQRFSTVLDTPTLYGRTINEPRGRTFTLGITRVFGGRPAREGQFEYDSGAAPG